jgi:hypothetical protein
MKISHDVIHREIAGEHILVPIGELALRRSGVFVITALGAEIWEMLKDGKEYNDIISELLESYEVTEEILTKDVDEFLQMLRENELVE